MDGRGQKRGNEGLRNTGEDGDVSRGKEREKTEAKKDSRAAA